MGDLNFSICMVYLNDLICYSKTTSEHVERMRRVFEQLQNNDLKLKPEKCKLFQTKLTYLGHHISKEGIRPSQDTVSAMVDAEVHNSYTGIRQFIGLVGSYRKFIKGFSALADGLYEHLRGAGATLKAELLKFSKDALKSIWALKKAITEAPVLAPVNWDKPFLLATDACAKFLGAELTQIQDSDNKKHPVAYGSTSLKGAQTSYHLSKLEFFALFWAVTRHFREYLCCSPFDFHVKTDNNPLIYVNTTAKLNATGHRWVSELASFNFTLKYVRCCRLPQLTSC